jgi:hypothetical protein
MKGLLFGPNATHMRASRHNPILSPNDGFEHENHFLMLIPYKGHYVMLYECGWYHPDGTGRYGAYSADIRLAHSRDCEHFTRINPHEVVIPRGSAGDWDSQFLVISDKAIVKDDKIYLYYAGQGTDWTSWPPGNAVEGDRFAAIGSGAGKMRLSRMGLATLSLDGFTCVRVPDKESFGSLITKPLDIARARRAELTVNLGSVHPRRSWLQVEVLDARTKKPLAGFSQDDCPPIMEHGLRVPVHWKGKPLGSVPHDSIRLRFCLFGDARLYSFKYA